MRFGVVCCSHDIASVFIARSLAGALHTVSDPDMSDKMVLDSLLAHRLGDYVSEERSPTLEGSARRHQLARRDGSGRALLYLWDSPHHAARAVHALGHEDFGSQLFCVPTVLDADVEQAWCLLEHPEHGEPLSDLLARHGAHMLHELPVAMASSIAESLGVSLRKLHSFSARDERVGEMLEPPHAAELGASQSSGRFHTFNGWVAARLERFTEDLNHVAYLDPDQRLRCLEYLGDLRHELSAFHPRHPAVFSHGAPAIEHLWVSDSSSSPEVVAITGFERAIFLPAEADVAYLNWIGGLASCDDAVTRAFYRGYGAAHTMDVQRRERFYRRLAAFHVLLDPRQVRNRRAIPTLVALAGSAVAPEPLSHDLSL